MIATQLMPAENAEAIPHWIADWRPRQWITPHSDGTYEPSPDRTGIECWTIPVYDATRGGPIDILAYPVDDATRWWLRRGVAVVLGEYELELAAFERRKVLVVGTPAEYIEHRGRAVMFIDWTADLRRALRTATGVIFENAAHARRFRQRLDEQVAPTFDIVTMNGGRR